MREQEEDGEEQAKALEEEQLRALLDTLEADPEGKGWAYWRPFFAFLAHSGCRIGEAIALQWKDVDLGQRRVHVRRRYYKGGFAAPKSKYGKRTIPLSPALAQTLWVRKGADEELVFTAPGGQLIDQSNVMARVLKPAARKAGIGGWVGFHTFRHTCATMLFRNGVNPKQAQVWLGHHSPAFTLSVYTHLLADELPDADFLDVLTGSVDNNVSTSPAESDREAEGASDANPLQIPDVPRAAEGTASNL